MAKNKGGRTLNAVIKNTLEQKIGEQVWEILKEHIEKDVYEAYSPRGTWVWGTPQDSGFSGYQRRRQKGLLSESDKNISVYHQPAGNKWTLRVTTDAQPTPSVLGDSWVSKPGGFLRLLEEGYLGFWLDTLSSARRISWPFPRPVITNAQAEANRNKKKYSAELTAAIIKAISEKD